MSFSSILFTPANDDPPLFARGPPPKPKMSTAIEPPAKRKMSTAVELPTKPKMSTAIELPASLDTTLALKFIPVIELQPDMSNFNEWEHSVRFYLQYHGLYGYIDTRFGQRQDPAPDSVRRDGLFVYSVIWESAKAVLPLLSKELSDKMYGNHLHDPKLLLEVLRNHRFCMGK